MHLLADQEPEIKFNYSSPNENVPDIEWSIRVIKERIRATYHRLYIKQHYSIRL
jgi:hypothetical protein